MLFKHSCRCVRIDLIGQCIDDGFKTFSEFRVRLRCLHAVFKDSQEGFQRVLVLKSEGWERKRSIVWSRQTMALIDDICTREKYRTAPRRAADRYVSRSVSISCRVRSPKLNACITSCTFTLVFSKVSINSVLSRRFLHQWAVKRDACRTTRTYPVLVVSSLSRESSSDFCCRLLSKISWINDSRISSSSRRSILTSAESNCSSRPFNVTV